MKTLKEFDQKYITALEAIPETLAEIKQKISTDYLFDNRTEEVSDALINRLKVYYESNQKIKNILNKGYLSNAADFLVESVLFYLHLYLQKHKSHLQAHSEKDILIEKWVDETGKKKKRVIRPDITIMHGKTVYAIIECKTQLGWNRNNWEKDFINRAELLKKVSPSAKAYLLVMTGMNWSGFSNHEKVGIEYFCLLNDIWPVLYRNPDQIMTKIETLFEQL